MIQGPEKSEGNQENYEFKSFQTNLMMLEIEYSSIVYNNQPQLKASIFLTPFKQLISLPLEVELKGYSHLQNFANIERDSEKSIEVTEDFLNETEDKIQGNILMGQSHKFESGNKRKKVTKIQEINESINKQGEYFLEGCNVIYQISEQNGQRLEYLCKNKRYNYPITFVLPFKLPVSIEGIVLKDIHIVIQYTLQIKIIEIQRESSHKSMKTYVIPFQIIQAPKTYPYQVLVLNQSARCYHATAKKKDQRILSNLNRIIRCICPNIFYQKCLRFQNHYQATFQNYDLFHLEVVANVNRNKNIFIVARAYREPDVESLTHNRQKSEKKTALKEVNSIGEVPNDVSLASIKPTSRKSQRKTGIIKVEVQMIGEMVGFSKKSLFKKMIYLNQSTYDMLEGEIMVNLNTFTAFPSSFHNQLFNLKYTFNATPFFGSQDGQDAIQIDHQLFIVEQKKQQLIL